MVLAGAAEGMGLECRLRLALSWRESRTTEVNLAEGPDASTLSVGRYWVRTTVPERDDPYLCRSMEREIMLRDDSLESFLVAEMHLHKG